MKLSTQPRTNKDTRKNARTLANYLKRNNFDVKQPKSKTGDYWDVNLVLGKQHKQKHFIVLNGKAVQENFCYVGRG